MEHAVTRLAGRRAGKKRKGYSTITGERRQPRARSSHATSVSLTGREARQILARLSSVEMRRRQLYQRACLTKVVTGLQKKDSIYRNKRSRGFTYACLTKKRELSRNSIGGMLDSTIYGPNVLDTRDERQGVITLTRVHRHTISRKIRGQQ